VRIKGDPVSTGLGLITGFLSHRGGASGLEKLKLGHQECGDVQRNAAAVWFLVFPPPRWGEWFLFFTNYVYLYLYLQGQKKKKKKRKRKKLMAAYTKCAHN